VTVSGLRSSLELRTGTPGKLTIHPTGAGDTRMNWNEFLCSMSPVFSGMQSELSSDSEEPPRVWETQRGSDSVEERSASSEKATL
jgi:hypothetical protein